MARRKATRQARPAAGGSRQRTRKRRSVKRPTRKAQQRKAAKRRATNPGRTRRARTKKVPRLERARRILDETVPTPPSSLNMNRHGSAVRTGRAEMAETLEQHRNMSPDIAGGDVDVDVEDAYFTGEEAPGGDNPTPDQDVVDDIGKALGVHYEDNEELRSSDKVVERDKHRWELDPASSEDYKDRK
jgi:hypothetical protein